MRRIVLILTMLTAALVLLSYCETPAGNSSTNKPANAAANNANAAAPVNTAAVEAEIKKLMDAAQTALAKNDADAMDKIYAENYMLVNLDGSVQTRAERLAALRSGDAKYTAFSYSEPSIRINPEGTGAVAIARLAMKGMSKGKPMDGDYRVTQVYAKTKDGWKQVSAQATKIEGAATTAPAAANANKTASNKKPAPPAASDSVDTAPPAPKR